MARSNTALGGQAYIDIEIYLVSDDGFTQTLRGLVYLTSPRVVDSVNSFVVGGNFSRSGNIGLDGVYSSTVIWSSDITVSRGVGYDQTVSISTSLSAVEYWGVALSASVNHVVAARYEAPSAPATAVSSVTTTAVQLTLAASSYNGGADIVSYEAFILTNNAWPAEGGNVVAGWLPWPYYAGGLTPSTLYYYTARALNSAGLWSVWTGMQTFWTHPGVPGTSVANINPTSAQIIIEPHANGGGAGIVDYEAYVLENNAWPGLGGVVKAFSHGNPFIATGLMPSTQYFYTSRSLSAAGVWSDWTPMKAFKTLPSAHVRIDGVWKNAIPYVKVDGVWRMASPFKKVGGVWKQ